MESKKVPVFAVILRYALYATFVTVLVGAASLPFTIDWFFLVFRHAPNVMAEYRTFTMILMMATAVPTLWVLLEMIWMLGTIPKSPFVMRNVTALNRIGIIFFTMAGGFLVSLNFFFVLTVLAGAVFLVCSGLFSFTFAALIRQGVVFREENDLTI